MSKQARSLNDNLPPTRHRHHQANALTGGVILTLLLSLLAACGSPYRDPRLEALPYPPDFTLVFRVVSTDADERAAHPLTEPSLYIVEPDRTLRVALGAGATQDYYPPPTATLTPDQMAELWQRAEQLQPTSNDTALGCYIAAQSTEPLCALDDHRIVDQGQVTTDDDADAFTPPVKYVIERTARGRGSIIHTTPDASPAATEVLIYLTELRGATPLSEP